MCLYVFINTCIYFLHTSLLVFLLRWIMFKCLLAPPGTSHTKQAAHNAPGDVLPVCTGSSRVPVGPCQGAGAGVAPSIKPDRFRWRYPAPHQGALGPGKGRLPPVLPGGSRQHHDLYGGRYYLALTRASLRKGVKFACVTSPPLYSS